VSLKIKKKLRRLSKLRLSKWILSILLFGCQLEPEVMYIPEIYEIRDTLYVHDTSYVAKEALFGVVGEATLYMATADTVKLVYWAAVTKLDSTPVDSVFLYGMLLEWNTLMMSATVMDCTQVTVWPNNAGSWTDPFAYNHGEFEANTRWHIDYWPSGSVTYTIGLRYR
jgi:hypothetical protein